jgi:chromosome partitioning protein
MSVKTPAPMAPWSLGPKSPLTLAVLNQKGGAGKTTLATNLAAAMHLAGARTILLDLDVQGSSLDWSAARKDGSKLTGLTVVKNDRAFARPRLLEMSRGYDWVVLDGPPRLGDVTRAAAFAADVVVIPVGASQVDLWAIPETLALLDTADSHRAELERPPARRVFVLNRAIAGTGLARQVQGMADLAIAGTVHQRIAFPEAAAQGESVLTTEEGSPAAFEIRRLWREIAGVREETT